MHIWQSRLFTKPDHNDRMYFFFSEIMYELRRIKMGDRPVTGQGNKENVEQFFQSRLSTEPVDTEQFRPEPVIVEVIKQLQ